MILFINTNFKIKATTIIEIQKVLFSSNLNVIKIYLRDGLFSNGMGIVNLHPSEGTLRFVYIKENYFDRYGCSPPQKRSRIIIKRNGCCLYSEYKKQGLTRKRD